ncbi:MAG: hypothetical protein KC502_06755 [Myxococcales bacterium]|nr:hypothetical protein [Myxococcales bacterium]
MGPAGKAVCKGLGNPTTGACWGDSQCPTGSTCEGEQVCPCGVSCLVPDKQGTCKKTLKPKGCDACTASEYCKYVTPNTCSGAGTCTTKPGLCAGIYKPVCGCDGKTYSNACGAAAAGRNVASEGGCKAP